MRINEIFIYTDAACKSNPGNAMIAVLIKDNKQNILEKFCEEIKNTTSNQAEYRAVLKGMEAALKHCRNKIKVFSDNKLLIQQLNRNYRIRNKNLLELIKQIKILELLFDKVEYKYVRRSKNKHAHKLAKRFL